MKTKSLQFEDFLAVLIWDKEIKKVFVAWYKIHPVTGFEEIVEWPRKFSNNPSPPELESKEMLLDKVREFRSKKSELESLEMLLSKVREFCSNKDLTLWSY